MRDDCWVGKIVIQTGGLSPIESFQVRMAAADRCIPVKMCQFQAGTEFTEDGPFMPVGSVEFCRAAMWYQGIKEPEPLDYPECIAHFAAAGHHLRTFADLPEGWTPEDHRVHAKPYHTKLDEALWAPETAFWIGNWHRFGPEYRVYIVNGEIVGCGRYDNTEDDVNDPLILDMGRVKEMADLYHGNGAPAGYGLDVGVSDEDGRTYLIEVNDGWALGFYRGSLQRGAYLDLLVARWEEIARTKRNPVTGEAEKLVMKGEYC